MSEFKREVRYFVAKVKDVGGALSKEEIDTLLTLLGKVRDYRKDQGKEDLHCVVIESKWEDEYEEAWRMVEERCIK